MIKQAKKIKHATQKISTNNVFIYIVMVLVLGAVLSWIKWNELQADAAAKKEAEAARVEQAAKPKVTAPAVILLDVRTVGEFEKEHRAGAMNIPLTDLPDKAAEMLPDKDAVILIYCRSGKRAEEAVKVLKAMGYNRLENLHI